MTARTIRICDEDGNETERTLPMVWAICGCCRGEGKSSLYLCAITQSDRQPGGSWEDPEDFEEYMRGGYDRVCDECEGSGKVQIVDRSKLTDEDAKTLRADEDEERDYQAMVAAERRFGC
jgi:hypothetical protein